MKKVVIFILAMASLGAVAAGLQKAAWIIAHNNKQRLKTDQESEAKNVILINRADLKKTGQLFVNYTGTQDQGWKRTISLFDTKDNELLRHGGSLLKVGNSKLNSLANSMDTIKIYTLALPADPAVAATVRVRRIHLATLVIKK
jgi:hypothetical protein